MADFTLNAPGTTNNPWTPTGIIFPTGGIKSDATGFRGTLLNWNYFAHNAAYGSTITTTVTMALAHSGGDDWGLGAMVRSGANAGGFIGVYFTPTSCVICTQTVGGTKTNISAGLSTTIANTDTLSVTVAISGGVATITASKNGTGLVFTGGNTTSTFASETTLASGAFFASGNTNGTYFGQFTGTGLAPTGAIAGTSALVLGQTGTLKGAGALAGSSALVLGETGVLKGAGALGGSSGLVLGQTGALAGGGALLGTTALTFNQTGALSGAGALTGASALTLAQTGALAGAGALSGSSAWVLGASGTATQPTSGGTAALLLGASGTLTGAGALSGVATWTLGASATADQPVNPVTQPGPLDWPPDRIADTAFRRKKKRRLVEIEQPAAPVDPIRVGAIGAVQVKPYDFRSLAELSGKSVEAFRAEIDQEIATLLAEQQERDDEEALTLILAALED